MGKKKPIEPSNSGAVFCIKAALHKVKSLPESASKAKAVKNLNAALAAIETVE